MPIKIYTNDSERNEIAWLCDDCWRLPEQIEALEEWLNKSTTILLPVEYIADIGFCVREDARGGGSAMSPQFLAKLAQNNIWLFLSEYDAFTCPPDAENRTLE